MNLKGVILAGGTGTRLMPLTKVTNKHLLAVGQKPMIYYPVEKLINADITEILIVTGVEHMGHVVSLLGSGAEFGCRFTYKVQDQAGGISQALGLAENFAHGHPVAVILGGVIGAAFEALGAASLETDLAGARPRAVERREGAVGAGRAGKGRSGDNDCQCQLPSHSLRHHPFSPSVCRLHA